MRNKILLLCFSCSMALNLFGQSNQTAIDNFFLSLSENQQFSGNVLLLENDEVVYEKSFGYADYSTKTPNNLNTSFPIASISKTLTATAILQLKERRLLKISDSVSKYLPSFPYKEIILKNLLAHTSGLPSYNTFFNDLKNENPSKVFTNNDFIRVVAENKKPLLYNPGEKGNYDNINYVVLALIVEEVSGMPYPDYIEKNILQPAGMNETSFFPLPEQFNTSEIENFAFPHLYLHDYDSIPVKANSIPYVRAYWHTFAFNGFGDYVSTTHDLWKFDNALYNNTLLKQRTLDEAFIPIKLNNGENNPGEFGLGWEIEKDSLLGKIVYHSGAVTGLSCIILRNITKHQTVILFDNAHYNAQENALKAMHLLNGEKVDYPKKSIAKIYGKVLLDKGAIAARDTLYLLKNDTHNHYLTESEINALGYDFMGRDNPYHLSEQHYYKQAMETFRMNVELFPNSWNVYDSYGEALLKNDQKEEAIKMYRKSIELNPQNENGKNILKSLLE